MTAGVNLGLVLIIAMVTYVGWRRNLYGGAILMGQGFFAGFAALIVSTPLTEMLKASFPVPVPYIRALATFMVWAVVLGVVDTAARSGLKRRETEKMKFHETVSIPGRLGVGLAAGFLIAGFLATIAVMVPRVEGSFVSSDSRVVMELPAKITALYGSINGVAPEKRKQFLKQIRVPAARIWAGNDTARRRKLRKYYEDKLGLHIERRSPYRGPAPKRPDR